MAELIIYGRDSCGLCSGLMKACDSKGIKYRKVSIETAHGSNEMFAKAQATDWYKASGGSVGLPVVDVFGDVMCRPKIADIVARQGGGRPAPAPPPPPPGTELIIYGRNSCGMCAGLKGDLDREGIPYRMVSIDDFDGNNEMFEKAATTEWYANSGGSVGLPVVDVWGDVMMRPSVADIKDRKGRPVPRAAPVASKPPGPGPNVPAAQPSQEDMQNQLQADLERVQAEVAQKGLRVTGVSMNSTTLGNKTSTTKEYTLSDGSTYTEQSTVER